MGGLEPDEELVRSASGLEHHVCRWGEGGERVLLLHGFLDQALSWARVARRLEAAGLESWAFDFRGHGETDWVGRGGYYHFPDYVRDALELLPQLSEEPVHLVGHSMGGTVACMVAALAPGRVKTLTLVEGIGPPDMSDGTAPERFATWLGSLERIRRRPARTMQDAEDALKRLRVQTPALDDELGAVLATRGTRPADDGEGLVWRFDPLHRTIAPMAFLAQRFEGFLRRVEAPTLAVFGERGLRLSDEDERLAAIGDVDKREIAGVGHMVHWLAADELADAIAAHVARWR